MNNEIFGQVGEQTFVNSAASISRERVDNLFPEARADGSVKTSVIRQKIIESGIPIQVGKTIIYGHTAIRIRVESTFKKRRGNSYCKRHTNDLIKEAGFIQEFSVSSDYSLQWAYDSTVDLFVENYCTE